MFWSVYPWWLHLFPFRSFPFFSPFRSFPFEQSDPFFSFDHPIPTKPYCEHITYPANPTLLQTVCTFLTSSFAKEPRLVFTPDTLLGPSDHLFLLRMADGTLIGTLRYHFIGTIWTGDHPRIHVVDAYCLHPAHRQKGYGAYLLQKLHHTANKLGEPHAIFLKEGNPLSLLHLPYFSGQYVYRQLHSSTSSTVRILSPIQAHRWITQYQRLYPETLLILSPPYSPNQHWRAYKEGHSVILACFQDTRQKWMSHSEARLGWATVWLESPNVTDPIRRRGAIHLSDSMSSEFEWLWFNRKWIGSEDLKDGAFQADGTFHWYTYQWASSLSVTQSYGIMN